MNLLIDDVKLTHLVLVAMVLPRVNLKRGAQRSNFKRICAQMDDEDDFMSDKFLEHAQQVDRQIKKTTARQAQSAAGLRKPSPKPAQPVVPARVKEQESRDVGLATPLGSDTKGSMERSLGSH